MKGFFFHILPQILKGKLKPHPLVALFEVSGETEEVRLTPGKQQTHTNSV